MAGTLLEAAVIAPMQILKRDKIVLPRPLVGIHAIERLLLRHVFAPVPEARLIVAVICQGIADTASRDDYLRRRACRFLQSFHLEYLADLVELNPEFVREVARRARYLTAEQPTHPQHSMKIGER
jgi:hypothetical protein